MRSLFRPRPRRRYHGLHQLDEKLERHMDRDGGFFVELGANDGVTQSNTYYFEKFRDWRGILIEPSPHKYLQCRANRSPESIVHCNACVGFDYADKYVDMNYANLMTVSRNLDLDLPDPDAHLSAGLKHLAPTEAVFSFGALAATLTDILARSDAPERMDLLSLDVEGAELEVLKGVDFDTYRFDHMVIEVRDVARMDAFLAPHGYAQVDRLTKHDILYRDTRLD